MFAHAGRTCIGNRKASGKVSCLKLVEPYPPEGYPKYRTPTFLVAKRDSTRKRMVGNFVKLNKRIKPHAGCLPPMETMVEK